MTRALLVAAWRRIATPPSRTTLFTAFLLFFYFIASGGVYVVARSPAMTGFVRDARRWRNVSVAPGVVDEQYSVEGFVGGLLFVVGALGFVLLDGVTARAVASERARGLRALVGMACVFVAFTLVGSFFRLKAPRYLAHSKH